MTENGLTDEKKKSLMTNYLAQLESQNAARKAGKKRTEAAFPENESGPSGVEGSIKVVLKKKRLPAHLEYIGKSPEEVVVGQPRKDWVEDDTDFTRARNQDDHQARKQK